MSAPNRLHDLAALRGKGVAVLPELAAAWRLRATDHIDRSRSATGGKKQAVENAIAGAYERAALDLCVALDIPLPPRGDR